MKRLMQVTAGVVLVLCGAVAVLAEDAQPRAYIIAPLNGAQVTSPVTIKFGLQNMGVAPAGVERANTGHHHLLIDVAQLPALDKPVPTDEYHRHFGGGQTETRIELTPGIHRLQLLLGDHNHVPHQPPVMSEVIAIEVQQ